MCRSRGSPPRSGACSRSTNCARAGSRRERSNRASATGISTPFTAGFTPWATRTSHWRARSSPPSRPAARPPPSATSRPPPSTGSSAGTTATPQVTVTDTTTERHRRHPHAPHDDPGRHPPQGHPGHHPRPHPDRPRRPARLPTAPTQPSAKPNASSSRSRRSSPPSTASAPAPASPTSPRSSPPATPPPAANSKTPSSTSSSMRGSTTARQPRLNLDGRTHHPRLPLARPTPGHRGRRSRMARRPPHPRRRRRKAGHPRSPRRTRHPRHLAASDRPPRPDAQAHPRRRRTPRSARARVIPGSLTRWRSTCVRLRISAWMSSVTSQTLTFMPGQHAAVLEPEGDELARVDVAAEDDLVPVGGVAGVLHADVVLVGEEVRDLVVGLALAEHARARPPGPARARCASARRAGAARRTGARRRRRRRPRRRSSAEVLSRSSTRMPSPTSSPAASASAVRGATPMPTTTKSQSTVSPPARRTRSARPEPSIASTATPRQQLDALVAVDRAVDLPHLAAEHALERHVELLDQRDLEPLLARRGRDLGADPAGPDHGHAAARLDRGAQRVAVAEACAGSGRRRGRRPAPAAGAARRRWRAAASRTPAARPR